MTDGLVTALPLADSMVLPRIGNARLQPRRRAQAAAPRPSPTRRSSAFDIRAPGPDGARRHAVGRQSAEGAARPRARLRPAVLVAAQPTRGLDIGAAASSTSSFLALRANGCGLIVISEDLEELLSSPTGSP